jgi:imidazolonepropionase-like amidohydrolase
MLVDSSAHSSPTAARSGAGTDVIPRIVAVLLLFAASACPAQEDVVLLQPDRVFDGETMHTGWVVAVAAGEIVWAGEASDFDAARATRTVELDGATLLPGLIEGHSHVLLHPYNETSWNDQVLKESEAERVARAVNHVRDSLRAGMTTMRDLGSEGAGYADVGIRDAIAKGIVPGPTLLVAGKAIVATGSYGPKGFHERVNVPLGAETADGYDDLVRVVRDQLGHGVDFIKIYADYRWGPEGQAAPTFTQQEIATIVEVTESSGRYVAAHAASTEGMRRAIEAGVHTIEHGDQGTREVFRLMRDRDVAFCPTLAVGEAIASYGGWRKGIDPDPQRIVDKKQSFRLALDAGVTMCFGGDVGPFPHGDNVRELELMVEYGMDDLDALRAATSVNARVFRIDHAVGSIREGLRADLVAVGGNPAESISALRDVRFVMSGGRQVD